VVASIAAAEFSMTRDELLDELRRENVLARRYFFPGAHRMLAFRPRPRRVPRH
jgi:hypothetical protein